MNPEKLNLNRNAAKQGFSGAQGIYPDNGRPLLIMLLRLRQNAAADILLPI